MDSTLANNDKTPDQLSRDHLDIDEQNRRGMVGEKVIENILDKKRFELFRQTKESELLAIGERFKEASDEIGILRILEYESEVLAIREEGKVELEQTKDRMKQAFDKQEFEVLAIKEKFEEASDENRILRERVEKDENLLLDHGREIKKLEEEKNALMKNITESATAQRVRESGYQKYIQELGQENTEYKKKCVGLFQQVVSMNSKQKETEEESDEMKRAFDHQAAELEEKKALNSLMSESLKSYEDDFRRGNEEKAKFQQMVDKAQQEVERTKRENQSHVAVIRHLEDEFERLNKMLNEERKRANDMKSKVPSPMFGHQKTYSAMQAAGTRSFMPVS